MKKIFINIIVVLVVGSSSTNYAQWYWQNPLPQGNNLRDVHVFDGNTAIAVGDAGTIIRTTDGGISWIIQYNELNITTFHFINNNTGWAIGYDYANNRVILRTDDGGQNWSSQYSTYDRWFSDIFFVNIDVGWVTSPRGWGGTAGILKTTDGGLNWETLAYNGFSSPGSIYFVNETTGWLLGNFWLGGGEILKTTNSGYDWTVQYQWGYCGITSIYFIDDSTGWAVGGTGDCGDQSYYSGIVLSTTNGGEDWFVQTDSIGSQFNDVYFTDKNNGWAAGVDYFSESLKVVIIQTSNGGENWVVKSDSLIGWPNSMSFSQNEIGWIVGVDGLILKTTGNDWVLQSSSHFSDNLYDIQFTSEFTGWALGNNQYGYGRLYKTTDGGNAWTTSLSDKSVSYSSFSFIDENIGWVTGTNNLLNESLLLKTTDGGVNWSNQSLGFNFYSRYIFFVNENIGWITGRNWTNAEGKILKSTDGGNSWINQFTMPDVGEAGDAFFVDGNNGWVTFWGNLGSSVLLHTTNGGQNWINQGTPLVYPYSIFFANESVGWLTGVSQVTNKILKTTNGGSTWFTQFENDSKYFRSIHFINQNVGWAAGFDGIYGKSIIIATTDGGSNWYSQPTSSSNRFNSVFFVDGNTGWAVGQNGTILKTTNGGGTVPIELTSFTATSQNGFVELNWTTASEINNQGFEIQRSASNSEFTTVGFVEGNGTTTEEHHYTYKDKDISGSLRYRLKQVDFDGSYEYSDIVEVEVLGNLSYALAQNYPNPFNPITNISYILPTESQVTLSIYNPLGELVETLINEKQDAGKYDAVWNAGNNPSGVYIYTLDAVSLSGDNQIKLSRKMILLK